MKNSTLIVVAGIAICLVGCGGGGGGQPVSAIQSVSGSVSSEFGSGTLKVLSGWAASEVPALNGTFAVSVAGHRSHLVYALDQAGLVHALAISYPGEPSLDFTPNSTAQALIFMTPGIYTSSSSEGPTRLAEISALPSFPSLVAVIALGAQGDLITSLGHPATKQAVAACVAEWFGAHPMSRPRPHSIAIDESGLTDFIGFAVNSASNPLTIQITNSDFRVLEVYERLVPTNGSTPIVTKLADMAGAEPVGLTGLVFGTIGEPATADVKVKMGPQGSYRAELYFRGLGVQSSSLAIPPKVSSAFSLINTAALKTVFWYVLMPVFEGVGGFADSLHYSGSWVQIMKAISSSADVGSALQDLGTAIRDGNSSAIAHATVDLAKAMFDEMSSDGLLTTLLIEFFKSQGSNAFSASLQATLSIVAAEGSLAILAVLDVIQLTEFVSQAVTWHPLNGASVTSDGTGGVTVH